MIPAGYLLRVVAGALLHSRTVAPRRIRPLLANLNLTENCNARCVTCDYWKSHKPDGISTERAKALVGECLAAGIGNLRFTGGDPLLRRDLFEIMAEIPPGKVNKIVLATNGLLLGRYAEEVNRSPITNVTVSIDAVDDANDKIRGVPGYYRKVLGNLERVRKPVKIASTLTSALMPHLPELLALCRERGYRYDVNILDTNAYFFASEDVATEAKNLTPARREALSMLEVLAGQGILSGCVLTSARHFIESGRFDFKHCMQGYIEVNIDSAGGVRTGCNVFEPVGNVNQDRLADIIASPAYGRSVRRMFDFDCPGCTCGYSVSSVLNRPFAATISYLAKRLR